MKGTTLFADVCDQLKKLKKKESTDCLSVCAEHTRFQYSAEKTWEILQDVPSGPVW